MIEVEELPTGDPVPIDVGQRGRDAIVQLLLRTIVMRGVTIVGTVVLARLLLPSDFGVFAVILLFSQVLVMVGEAGMAAGLVQQHHEPTPSELGTAWVSQQFIWVPGLAIVWLLTPVIHSFYPTLGPDFEWQLRVTALIIPLIILRSVPAAMLTRDLRFRALATIEVIQHFTFYGTSIGLAVSGAGVWSFVIAVVAQTAVGAVLVNLQWGRRPQLHFDRRIARRQLGFGAAYQASNIIASSRDAVVPVFGALAGGDPATAIGRIGFGFDIGQAAATVDDILARVTFPAFSRLQGDARRIAKVASDLVVVGGLVVAGVQVWLIASAPYLVPEVFGAKWIPAVPAMQLVCLGTLATVPTGLLRSLVLGQRRSRAALGLALASTVTMVVLFPPLVVLFGIAGGGLAFVGSALLALAVSARAVRAVAPFPWFELGRVYVLAALAGLAAWLVAATLGGRVGLIASGLVFVALDAALAWLFARRYVELILSLIRRRGASGTAAVGP